ncbi:Protein-S-isoprenylcysteine O-methyltransferase [Coccomyxa sp. Obi]|nr:Protein-S-isoprenylcysteine O-methyltransferase [Coccomyxa sp. Obi]
MVSLSFFHGSEFFLAFLYNRQDLSRRSWLVSKPYCLAMLAAILEYSLESMIPALRTKWISVFGLGMIIVGEIIRKTAMITAQHNFTHVLQSERRENHVLVTHGIYRYFRHPGYFGWLLWMLGTQVLLVNPICIIVFITVAWHFFRQRITFEEEQLHYFFGQEYDDYAEKVPTRIPFLD